MSVFAEIAADLNLDQFERYRAGIGQAMDASGVDRFVFMDGADFRSDGDFGGVAHHQPARWKCFCSDSMAFGFATMHLTL